MSAVRQSTRVMDFAMTTTTIAVVAMTVATAVDQVVKLISLLTVKSASARIRIMIQTSALACVKQRGTLETGTVMTVTTIVDVNGTVATAADSAANLSSISTVSSANVWTRTQSQLQDVPKKVHVVLYL